MCPVRYFAMLRSKNHVFDLRLHLVRFAFEHGIRSAARHVSFSPRYAALYDL